MSTMSTNPTTERPRTLRGRLSAVPWLTVVPLAVVMGYADGFWLISLRGTVGSIERTQEPFASWLRESTLSLPFFVLAVVAALTLAARWLRPALRTSRTVLATALLVVAAGTLVGIAEVAASSAYDYHLQSSESHLQGSMGTTDTTGTTGTTGVTGMTDMAGMTTLMGSKGATAEQKKASLELQVRAVAYGSGLLLVTNFVLVGWVVAMRGGRLNVITTRH